MGLPQNTPAPEQTTTNNAEPSTSTSQPPSNSSPSTKISDLPPAAIDLATKLFDYARQGSTSELSAYITAGIPPNLTNHKGDTLLMLAAYHGHADTVAMLLRQGADPNTANDRGQSPIAGAVFKGHDEVVRVLYEGVDGSARAEVWAGQPNAVDAARMFKKDEYLALFGVEGMGDVPGVPSRPS